MDVGLGESLLRGSPNSFEYGRRSTVGRRFRHLGEEWDAESAGTAGGTGGVGEGEGTKVTEWEVEFRCLSNPSKGPYKGNIGRPNPAEVSEDDLKTALEHAISEHKIEAIKKYLSNSVQGSEVQHSYDHDRRLHTFTVHGAKFFGRISLSQEYFFDLPSDEEGITRRLGEDRVPHTIKESNSRNQRVVYVWDNRGHLSIRWEPL
jgi:hypothetical protein